MAEKIDQMIRRECLHFYGFHSDEDLVYWGSGADEKRVDDLEKFVRSIVVKVLQDD